jgi:2-(3-amino-3-carboxypropyl)histidine synthase
MEEDREETNLGIAADVEAKAEASVPRQPKKRFVGRKQAAENAEKNGSGAMGIEDSGAIQGIYG